MKFKFSPNREYKFQIFATITANLISMAHGAALGWFSPALIILESFDTPFPKGPLTVEETSWFGSIYNFGAIVGNLIFGAVASTLGSKNTLCSLAFPQVTFWLLIIFGDNIHYLLVARFLAGFAGGGLLVGIPLFVTEIADKKIRGALGSILAVSLNLGVLLGYALGAKLSYQLFPSLLVILPASFFVLMCLFPETPQYHLSRNKQDRAKKSLAFYRNLKKDPSEEESAEFESLFILIRNKVSESKLGKKIHLSDFCEPQARKGMILSVNLCFIYMFCGIFVTLQHTANIFKETKVSLDPNICAIIIGASLLTGTLVSVTLVDHLGRRALLIGSCICTGLGFLLTGIHVLLTNRFDVALWDWVPVATLSLAIFSASAGLFPVIFIIMAELIPSQIRPVGSSICNAMFNLAGFITIYTYPILVLEIYLYGVMFLYVSACVIGLIFIILCIPETKGQFV